MAQEKMTDPAPHMICGAIQGIRNAVGLAYPKLGMLCIPTLTFRRRNLCDTLVPHQTRGNGVEGLLTS